MLNFLPAGVETVLQTLTEAGYEAYLVGGCVRDYLLGRPVHDYDLATNATPDAVCRLFPKTVPTGLQHGTVTVLAEGTAVEVTTYRKDVGYSDGRHPDKVVFCSSLQEDLARRDFTVNAMAMDQNGNVIDPFEGKTDLRERRIRAVGRPSERFAEDGLRILRAFRFAAQLGFAIDPETYDGMQEQAHRLRNVSRERIGDELARLAAGEWWTVAGPLADSRVWPLLGRLEQALADAFRQFADEASVGEALGAVLGGWPAEERTTMSFALWCLAARLGRTEARELARSLRWPNRRIRANEETLALLASDPASWTPNEWRHRLLASGLARTRKVCQALDALDQQDRRQPSREELCQQFAASQPIWSEQELEISGREIVELGAEGPVVGRVIQHLLDAVLSSAVVNERGALMRAAADFLRNQNGVK
jgi:tRNA nucleotidyltransferase (CCA-adding enzyme)